MIGTPEAAKQLRRYLEENILYDCYMAQPAWIAHMFCYEYLAEQMATLLGLIEIFYDSEKAKEFRDTAKMLTSRAEDIQANSNADDKYQQIEVIDQQYWDLFDDVVKTVGGLLPDEAEEVA